MKEPQLTYNVIVRSSAEKELRKIPKPDLARILKRIHSLADNPTPQGSIKLEDEECYRVRQGDWRILYEIDHASKTVSVFKVGHRREVYR